MMPFTELKILGFLQTPQVLQDLVRWPTRLEKFRFRFSYRPDYAESGLFKDWSLGTLAPIIEIHKGTLHSILISHLCESGLAGFDLSDFKKLKYLSLSSKATGKDTNLIANILAPNLETFRWDLTLEDQQCTVSIHAFGQPEEDWLRALAAAAIERKSALRKIQVKFVPEYRISWGVDPDTLKYPWDRMEAIARDIRPKGIELLYSEPAMSKEDFEKAVAKAMVKKDKFRRGELARPAISP